MYGYVVLYCNCREKPAGHICKYPGKITVVDILDYVMSVCMCIPLHWHMGEGGYLDSAATECKVKNLYSASCCAFVGNMLQL